MKSYPFLGMPFILYYLQALIYLDLLCVRQLDAAPFCENYAKLYFDAKHSENRLNRGW